jgi:hypothetical protein
MSDETNQEQEELHLFGDVTDFDIFKGQVQALFISLSNEIEKRLQQQSELIEKLEQQFAMIYVGYVEQAAVIETALISMFSDSPEKEDLFRENLDSARQKFFDMLKEGADDVLAGEDPRTAAAIKDMVDKKLSN